MGKKRGPNKKDGVEFQMMFRHHQDPLYYDTNANAKIFMPVDTTNLTEEQHKIIESFPAEDRGKVLSPEEYAKKGYGKEQYSAGLGDNMEAMCEIDQFEAAAKRMRIKEQAAIEKRKKKMMDKDGISFLKDGREKMDNPFDSEEYDYTVAAKAQIELEEDNAKAKDSDQPEENEYDSEFEELFFGKKDKELNRKEGNLKEEKAEESDEQI